MTCDLEYTSHLPNYDLYQSVLGTNTVQALVCLTVANYPTVLLVAKDCHAARFPGRGRAWL